MLIRKGKNACGPSIIIVIDSSLEQEDGGWGTICHNSHRGQVKLVGTSLMQESVDADMMKMSGECVTVVPGEENARSVIKSHL